MTAAPHSDWVQLPFGTPHDLRNPLRTRWRLDEIARGLSRLCRFAGATHPFYSVAQHCTVMAQIAPAPFRLACLLHDAHEIVTSDIPSPVKRMLGGVKIITDPIDAGITRDFGLPHQAFDNATVRALDQRMFATEVRDMVPPGIWEFPVRADPFDFILDPWGPEDAERRFITTAVEILIADRAAARTVHPAETGEDDAPIAEESGGYAHG